MGVAVAEGVGAVERVTLAIYAKGLELSIIAGAGGKRLGELGNLEGSQSEGMKRAMGRRLFFIKGRKPYSERSRSY